ncbi:transcriptional regulator [Actinomycetospora sp. NBRC 106375]|uniref:AraC-like ligand-binding domain-containing protein n=1 Tax=Actinomycetospora sp. NBRC 106375 TaxID=3032207 RepID=UPI0024A5CBA8|nr:helix-turn-helix domain-containing protein [Actinomycetospora sp. NBRC 106375]GLZ50025.1 transcriptional regulator [Actinomycetospora sp. NBRC 106375]
MGATPAAAAWSTTAVDQDQAFDYWRDLICDAFVQLSARPGHDGPFDGAIEHQALDDVELSTVTADAQRVDRTRTLIARSHEDYVLASIQLDGYGRIRQDGRVACLRAGAMAFYDSTRPYTLEFGDRFRQLVIQVPRSAVPHAPVREATAVTLDAPGPGRVVTEFFVGMAREAWQGHPTPALVPHALGLLELALGLAASTSAGTEAGTDAATRQQVRTAIARAAALPGVSAEDIAAACHISRRTLFRVLAAEGATLRELLRGERVRRAEVLLRGQPHLPVAVVAARCGFGGEAQLHRAFRDATGVSPGAYRSRG